MRKIKKSLIRIIAIISSIALLVGAVSVPLIDAVAASNNWKIERPVRAKTDTSFKNWITIPEEDILGKATIEGEQLIEIDKYKDFELTAKEKGKYFVAISYKPKESVMLDSDCRVEHISADNTVIKSFIAPVYSLWQDSSKDYQLDRYGNEVTPSQKDLGCYITDYLRDSASVDASPVVFEFDSGVQKLRITAVDAQIYIKEVFLIKYSEAISYEEYKSVNNAATYNGNEIIIEGEDYAVKSDSFIRSKAGNSSAVYPFNPYYKWLASVDGSSWGTVGQRIVWNFTVPEDGYYNITFHYSQSYKEGQDSCRTIEVDGAVPYKELIETKFPYTGGDFDYKQTEGKVYLTKGEHTLGLLIEIPHMSDYIDRVNAIIEQLKDLGLSLQQVAGSEADQTRTWDIESYIPGITENLKNIKEELAEIYKQMEDAYGDVPAGSLNLQLSADILTQILEKPEKLPTRTEEISIGSGSVTNLLAELINGWKSQGLTVDRIYLTGDGEKLPNANGAFLTNISDGVKSFFFALTSRNQNYSTGTLSDDALNVWVNRSVPYVETIQMLSDSRYKGYTDENGKTVKVNFSIMPDESKLLLANASGTCPDLALGVTGDRPYQLGIRNAVSPFTQFEDFKEYVGDKFGNKYFESYIYDGEIYALPETQQFYVMMYRKDILEKLELEVPRTWDEVAEIMPTLRRNGMNFYLPLSAHTGTKPLGTVVPFLYQAASAAGENPDYSLWTKDGMSTAINNEINISAFEKLTDLYLLYGVQNNMPSFYNNFRYGVSPIGVGGFGDYIKMLYAAPEIADDWAIAEVPGFEDENGVIHNQMPTAERAIVMFESSNKKEASWDFVKWWLEDETQIEFSTTLQAKFGSVFVWNSANRNAFAKLAIPEKDKKIIIEQWENAQNIRQTPANYMLERSLSNAWYDVVQNHINVRSALNTAAADIQQEFELKLHEFGYIDDNGKLIKNYDMSSFEDIISK